MSSLDFSNDYSDMVQLGVSFSDITEPGSEKTGMNRTPITSGDDELFQFLGGRVELIW